MEKMPEIFTEEFYKQEFLTLEAFNTLIKENLVTDKDMYTDGTFLTMSVSDTQRSRELLSVIIIDFDKYNEESKRRGYGTESNDINLCVAQEEHQKAFSPKDEIMWDREEEEFIFRCMLDDDEDYSDNEDSGLVDFSTCRVCGCTDYDCSQCIKKTGTPCHWVENDLCSACVESKEVANG